MTTAEADEMLEEIGRLALILEDDEELKAIDPRYAICAGWIDTNLDNITLEDAHA